MFEDDEDDVREKRTERREEEREKRGRREKKRKGTTYDIQMNTKKMEKKIKRAYKGMKHTGRKVNIRIKANLHERTTNTTTTSNNRISSRTRHGTRREEGENDKQHRHVDEDGVWYKQALRKTERAVNDVLVGSLLSSMNAIYGHAHHPPQATSAKEEDNNNNKILAGHDDVDLLTRRLSSSYRRFYVLETVARVPYFAFTSCLHLFETLGWWRRSEYLKIHFAQSWNELHHLLIMEALGGDERYADRFFAQHASVAYFWLVCGMYLISPRMAYDFQEKIEAHAFETYDDFVKMYADVLKDQPPPDVAVKYYTSGEAGVRMFGNGGGGGGEGGVRKTESLLDVFINVRDDEAEHRDIMHEMQRDRIESSGSSSSNSSSRDATNYDDGMSGDSSGRSHGKKRHQLDHGVIEKGGVQVEMFSQQSQSAEEGRRADDIGMEKHPAMEEEAYGCEGILECVINDLVPTRYGAKVRRRREVTTTTPSEGEE